MKLFKISCAALLALSLIAFTGCKKDKDEDLGENVVKMLGHTYKGVVSEYQDWGEEWINFDQHVDPDEGNIHGFHSFSRAGIGKTITIGKDEEIVAIAFNFNEKIEGLDHYYPKFKSGTQQIKKAGEKYQIIIDAKDEENRSFYMNVYVTKELINID